MRNCLIALSLIAGTALMPALASAQASGASSDTCVNLAYDMSIGSRDAYLNGEVTILQKFLGTRPTTISPYLTTNTFGFFGTQTEAAVRKFQEDQGLPAVGALGPLTRAKIRELTCGGGGGGGSDGGGSTSQNFTGAPAGGSAPLSVNFTFQSTLSQTQYWVDFADGNSSSPATLCPQAGACSAVGTVSHTYASPGTYQSRLLFASSTCSTSPCPALGVVGTTTITVSAPSTAATTAFLTFNGATSSINVDPLAKATWVWSATNADVITSSAAITGCSDETKNATINSWTPWTLTNALKSSGSVEVVPGPTLSGCTMNVSYSASNSATEANSLATVALKFKIIPDTAATACTALSKDLTVGSVDTASNKDVTNLQKYLQSTNSSSTGFPYLFTNPTGYYGPLTRAAVRSLQEDKGLAVTGIADANTRARIESLTCGGTGSITVTAPNGGEQWEEGVTNTVTWIPYNPNSGVNPAKDVTAYLEAMDGAGNFVNYGKVQESGKASIHWVTGELDSVTQGGNFAPPGGGYYVRVINNITGAWDRSDNPFTLVQRPIILMVNGTEGWVSIADVNQPITLSWTTVPGVSTCQLSGIKEIPFSTIQPNNGSVSGHIAYQSLVGGISYGVSLQCMRTVNNIPTQVTAYAKFSVASIPQIPVSLQVTSHNVGEQIDPSKQMVINYAQSGLISASVALYKNDQWKYWIIKDQPISGPATSSVSWNPSVALQGLGVGDNAGSIFKIYVTGQRADGQGYIDDKSDVPFAFVTGGTNPNAECTDLQNDLSYRSTDAQTNGEVSLLQLFLQSATSPSTGAPYLAGEPTGFFGQLTRAAVVQFQTDNGIQMTGTVGSATRAKIKALTCDGTSQVFSATPTSGSVPLTVKFTSKVGTKIDFGDGTSESFAYCLAIGCPSAGFNIEHAYLSVGTYTARAMDGQNQTVGTATIVVTGITTPAAECTDITHDLSLRSTDSATGGDVSLLQLFLQSVVSPSTGVAYLASEPTGFFGQLTKAGVMQYQTDNGITSTGVVGPITRARIKDISCEGTVPPPASAPTVSLTASPDTITCTGSSCGTTSSALGWDVKNASMCVASGGAGWSGYAPNGSWRNTLAANGGNSAGDRSVSLTATTTYQLECTNDSSNVPVRDTATVTVAAAPSECSIEQELQSCANGAYAARIGPNCTWAVCPYNPNPTTQAPTITSFAASSTALKSGDSTNLSWSVASSGTAGTSCFLATNTGNPVSVPVNTQVYKTGPLTADTTYRLSCYSNDKQSSTVTKDVTVLLVAIKVDTRTLTPSGHYLGTFDDFRGGGYNGVSTQTSLNNICTLAGKSVATGNYACVPTSVTDSAESRRNGGWGIYGTGQGWCEETGVEWVECARK